jgi:hypothetical protein
MIDYSPGEYIKAFEHTRHGVEFHLTPDTLFVLGMCKCSDCGYVNSVDNKYCVKCNEAFVVFRQ